MDRNSSGGYYKLTKNAAAKQPFHFVLKAPNHETILSSENYASKEGALNGIKSVRTNSQIDERFEKKTSVSNEPYFVLKAANGEIIGVSEMYSSPQARDNGIEAVKKYAKNAELEDETDSDGSNGAIGAPAVTGSGQKGVGGRYG